MKLYSWKELLGFLLLVYLPVLIIGLLFSCLSELLLVSFFAHIIWHYYYLKKLNDWLWNSKSTILPPGKSVWEDAFVGIHNMQQRYRRRRSKLAGVISRFREGSEALPDAVVVFHKSGEIIWCNRLAQFQLGFKWPDDSGENITNLIRDPIFVEYLRRADYQEPLDLFSPNNPDKILEFRVMPYATSQRLLIVRDVTTYRQMDDMRRMFVANVSHELRTPLTVLQGYIEILEMQATEGSAQGKAVAALDQQTARMCSLVDQLMVLSKIENGAEINFNETVNMAGLLYQIEEEAMALGKRKSLQINFTISPEILIIGNAMQLRSAVSNLIYNAVKYTPENGEISVEWSQCAQGAFFRVKDNGGGIAEEHLLHLTERFYRVDSSRSRDTGGSGLGLSIVKHVLTHYDCELSIESKLNQGSEFSFIIPNNYLTM